MDSTEFEGLYREYFQELCTFAQSYLDVDAARDVVQDVLFELWERRETLNVRESLRGYLFGAVRNRALNVIRDAQTHHRMHEKFAIQAAPDDLPALGTAPITPVAAAEYSDLYTALESVLSKLPERQRVVLDLKWNHGLTYDQISTALGISVQAAKMQVNRAQGIIRPLLRRFKPNM